MKILLLGGTGNLSTDIATRFLAQGHEVTLLTRGHNPIPKGFLSIQADRHDAAAMAAALDGHVFDVVADFTTYQESDAIQMHSLFRGRCAQYIYVSTTCVYVKPPKALPITEDEPQGNAFSPYGQNKQKAEDYFWKVYREENFPLTVVRPSHTYSRLWIPNPVTSAGWTLAWRMEQHLPIFIHDDGESLWTLTHTRDFAVGFTGLAGRAEAIGQAYQITSDFVLTWNQIVEEIRQAVGVEKVDIRHIPSETICRIEPFMTAKLFGDKANNGVFDCAKIKRLVPEFQCRIPFHEGIQESIAWFRQDSARMVPDPKINAVFDHVIAEAK